MKSLTTFLCLALAVLLFSATTGVSTDLKKMALNAYGRGDAKVQFALGASYYYGKGVPQNYKTAVKWYTLAANQGHVDAQFKLGEIYHFGIDGLGIVCWGTGALGNGIPRNDTTAVKWFTLAADQGHGKAQNMLRYLNRL